MQHNQSPYHFEKYEKAVYKLEAYNPLCGDQFKLFLDVKGQLIEQLHFHGYGCAVSKASTSLMVQELEGRNLAYAKQLIDEYLAMLEDSPFQIPPRIQGTDLEVFSISREYPARLTCASLAWKELGKWFESR